MSPKGYSDYRTRENKRIHDRDEAIYEKWLANKSLPKEQQKTLKQIGKPFGVGDKTVGKAVARIKKEKQ